MAYAAVTKPTQGTATKKSQIDQLIDNDAYLYNAIVGGQGGIVNGSFESDAVGTSAPTGWTRSANPGTSGVADTDPAHGDKYWYGTNSGSGACTIITENGTYVNCAEGSPFILSFYLTTDAAGTDNTVTILWYDKDQSGNGSTVIYDDSTANPTDWRRFVRGCIPPAGSVQCRVQFELAQSGGASGTTSIDGIEVMPSTPFLLRQEGDTITEQTSTAAAFENKGSVTVHLPTLSTNSFVIIRLMAQHKSASGAVNAYQRLAIGTSYSTSKSTVSTSYTNAYHELILLGSTGGDLTMYQQLYSDGGSSTAYGKFVAGTTDIEIVVP